MTLRGTTALNGGEIGGEGTIRHRLRSSSAIAGETKFERVGGHLPDSAAIRAFDDRPFSGLVELENIPCADTSDGRLREGRWRSLGALGNG